MFYSMFLICKRNRNRHRKRLRKDRCKLLIPTVKNCLLSQFYAIALSCPSE
ncbi:hypothetical protein LX69_00162 [Breznakibacter xylanolyticus]|uniref:Uncharacterized protein n=1 Tax=Breznakibacter xylanolyticus TaxID=990 RepID=A0A2W7NRK6_9BACT|nr:hypothetical protein LX69_00162 [Breznakibacter xylanolyticus]